MLNQITTLAIGFSVISAAILLIAYAFFLEGMQKSRLGLLACTVLLAALAGLQFEHLRYLQSGAELFGTTRYTVLLLLTPPSFFFFSKEVLLPEIRRSVVDFLHFLPLVASFFLPAAIIAPFAFLIGTGYAFWFVRFLYGMREQRARFGYEIFFFVLFAILAVLVLLLGLLIPYMDPGVFYVSYTHFIAVALLLVVAALLAFPDLLTDITDAARLTYATSTLGDVDVDAKIRRLEDLMNVERIFENENLSLAVLAEALDLTGHQLSELINTRFGIGYSRYVRERRVAEAKRLLRDNPDSSILDIALQTGFKSQSNFYAAFRDIVGISPGAYRHSPE